LITIQMFGIVPGMSKSDEPEAINCYFCGGHMEKKHRFDTERFVRVLWKCTKCPSVVSNK